MSAIVLSGGRILGIGGGIFAVGGSSPPPPTPGATNITKFTAGPILMTVAQNGAQASEISTVAASYKQAGTGACIGYSPYFQWSTLEPTLGNYVWTSVDNGFLNLQSSAPGSLYFPQFMWMYVGTVTVASMPTYNPQGSGIPAYILSNPGTYGSGPSGSSSSYGGWMVQSYNGSNAYTYTLAAFYRSVIYTRILALYQAYANHIIPDGLGYTADQHPLIGGVGTSVPTDLSVQEAPNIPGDYTYQAVNDAWQVLAGSGGIKSFFPHTPTWIMPGFGPNSYTGANDPTQQNSLLTTMDSNGVALSCTDVFYPQSLTYAQNYFIGNNYNGSTGFQSPKTGIMHSIPSVQGDDWTSVSQAQVSGVLGVAYNTLKCQNVMLCVTTANDEYAIPGFWNSYVLPVINAYSVPTQNQELPADYMTAPQNFSATTTATTATLSWSPQTTYTGINLVYQIYRNGSLINTTASTSVSTYTDTGLSANTQYTYTINLSNANGVGPQSTWVATTAVFSYPSGFASAHAAFNLCTDANAYSGANILVAGALDSAHSAGAAWYNTQVNIQSFTATATLQLPTLAQMEAAAGGAVPPGNIVGVSFSVQNCPYNGNPYWVEENGAWASGDSNMAGFGSYDLAGQYPLSNIVSILFGQNPYETVCYPGSVPNYMGLYLNGGPKGNLIPFNDISSSGLSFYNGNLLSFTAVYDGTLLTIVVTDTVTGAQVRQAWPVNIPAVLGSDTGWVGFTAGEIPACDIPLSSFSYWTGYNSRLATPTVSPASGEYSSTQSVTLSGPPGASIYYTTNGLLPTTQSTPYTGAFAVSANTVVQWIAIQSGYTDSLVGTATYQIGTANVINFPSGFSAGEMALCGIAALSGSSLLLTNSTAIPSGFYNGSAGAAWFPAPVNIQTFTANFQLQWTSASGTGMTFCIQNQPPTSGDGSYLYVTGGPNALGGSSIGLGYAVQAGSGIDEAGILSSVAMAFDLYSVANSVGVYTNGAIPQGSQTASGLTFNSGHLFNCVLTYNGTTLTLSMTDATTSANFTHSWTVNIPSIVGGNTAYVGFTGGCGDGPVANQAVNSFTFLQG